MAQIVSNFKEVIAQLRHFLPTNAATARAIDDGYIESADEFVRFDDVKELRAPCRSTHFEDRRCPVCGSFGCGGC